MYTNTLRDNFIHINASNNHCAAMQITTYYTTNSTQFNVRFTLQNTQALLHCMEAEKSVVN